LADSGKLAMWKR